MTSFLRRDAEDEINPLYTFDVPNSTAGDIISNAIGVRVEGSYSILAPSFHFWFGVMVALAVSVLFGLVLSSVLYNFVLPMKKTGPATPYIIGFGLIIPACFLLPYAFIDITGIQNSAVRFTHCAPLILYAFRCVEAMFGFTPPAVTSSPLTYAIYYASPVEFMFDRKTGRQLKVASQSIKQSIIFLLKHTVILMISFGLFSPYTFEPFQSKNAREERLTSVKDYFDIKHLGNCFIIALMFQQVLTLSGAAFATIVHIVTGYRAVEMMRNPMLEAVSPSDFWGKRWNVVVHGSLKRGVFKPVQKYFSSFAAVLMAFIASGLFHEYLVHTTVLYKKEARVPYGQFCPTINTDYVPQIGSNMAFFAWNGVVMVIEKLLGRHRIIRSFGLALPRFVVTCLIIMTALPVAHWFGNPYAKKGMFCDFQEGFPSLIKIA